MNKLLENTTVRLTTAATLLVATIGLLGGAVGMAIAESRWRTNVTRDLSELRADVQALKEEVTGSHSWHRRDAQLWVSEFRRRNPELDVPAANTFD